jgi:hypothetical protein
MANVAEDGLLPSASVDSAAALRYLLLADISGYTGFLAGVERAHGVDFSGGIPAGFGILGELLDGVILGIEPDFGVVKLEGDAVFAAAMADRLDGQGETILKRLGTMYRQFVARRDAARAATDDQCSACVSVSGLDLKVVIHRGRVVRQRVGTGSDLLGPAVKIAHRLLKNSIRARIGFRPYLFVTDAAAAGLGITELGVAHTETYADVGAVGGRVIDLDGN